MRALVAAFAVVLLLTTTAWALVAPGMQMPALTLPDTTGATYDLRQLAQGKVTVLVYWSVSCPICRKQMPFFLQLHRRLTGNPFVMLFVNGDGPAMAAAAAGYARRYNMPGPILLDQGPGDSMPVGDTFDIVGTPTVLVFDRKGKLVHAQETHVDMAKLKQAVEAAF